MSHNLQMYHKTLGEISQLNQEQRVTRRRNLALLVVGLVASGAIHLSQIVSEWPLPGKEPSLVNRLRRFLANESVCVQAWYAPVVKHLVAPFAGDRLRLVMDCSKVGNAHRMLMVGLCYRKRTLPLLWSVHPGRKGHVTTEEQIALLTQLLPLLPDETEVWLLADAGFQHVPLLRWLKAHDWHFVIRQQGRITIYRESEGWQKLNTLPLREGDSDSVGWVRLTQKYKAGPFWLILHWEKGEDEPWYLISDQSGHRALLRLYKKRMWIEEMFGDMKGHGFDLEATQLRHTQRIQRLLLGVCFAFTWLLCLGAWVVKRGFRHFIDRNDRRDKSYFRLGFDWIKYCNRSSFPVRLHFTPYPN